MATVYYKPAEVLHWIGSSSKEYRDHALKKGRDVAKRAGEYGWAGGLKQAGSAIGDLSRMAMADVFRKHAESLSYVLDEEWFESHQGGQRKRVSYRDVKEIAARGSDRYTVIFEGGSVSIKPIAHLVAGRLRVPIGWLRNGMEVPYAVLIEELAARCGVEVEV